MDQRRFAHAVGDPGVSGRTTEVAFRDTLRKASCSGLYLGISDGIDPNMRWRIRTVSQAPKMTCVCLWVRASNAWLRSIMFDD